MTGAVADHHVPTGASSRDLHRVIVVGGGAGGLELVTRLGDRLGRHKLADVSLVERARTHLWKPLFTKWPRAAWMFPGTNSTIWPKPIGMAFGTVLAR